ncbi:MAG: hydrogenase expression/formation protein HypE [Ruminococcus sp.]|nr:hydrogenase expression/formation protein HypE [Ruminococcus sp.]
MKAGKLSQAVWARSVQKQLNFDGDHFLLRPSRDEMCTAMHVPAGRAALTATACVSGHARSTGAYGLAKAVNDLAARGAEPVGIAVQMLLPVQMDEQGLKETVRHMEQLCRKLQIQIAGIQAESSPAVSQMIVQVTALGTVEEEGIICPAGARPGQDIVLCGYIGLEGMLRILDECEEELAKRFSPGFLRQMRAMDGEILQIDAIRNAWKYSKISQKADSFESSGSSGNRVAAMQQVGSGGIFGALWELAEAAGIGLEVDLKKMSIRQETVEVCEYYHLNPYQMTSAGAILMVAEHGERLAQSLRDGGARASMLGVTAAGSARVITSEGEKRFLDRPAPDELMRWWEERTI